MERKKPEQAEMNELKENVNSEKVKNAHAAGDGAVIKSDEALPAENDESMDTKEETY